MNFRNKRILITAGPTWVPIDSVRVISNIATGQTGILLAERLQRQGAKVTLLLGPAEACCLNKKIELIRFRFFDELKDLISKELSSKNYNIVIHSAAIADYQLKKKYTYKVKSDLKGWRLSLAPTVKIIDLIKKINPSLFLVGFKFEPQAGKDMLIKEARELIRRAMLDLAAANTIDRGKYKAYIIDKRGSCRGPLYNKEDLAQGLISLIGG